MGKSQVDRSKYRSSFNGLETSARAAPERRRFLYDFFLAQARALRAQTLVSQQAHIYRWDRHGRKGQLCIVVARGTMNSCLVKFEDGYTMVTSRDALPNQRFGTDGLAVTLAGGLYSGAHVYQAPLPSLGN
jgi:hypothetical protein